jgi:heme peroxidase
VRDSSEASAASLPDGNSRFGRLFPDETRGDPGSAALEELIRRLVQNRQSSTSNRRIPAGYTYLGQFIDHDITFDPTSRLDRDNVPDALPNFRTPRFDLDSLYGTGPKDQPFLYDWSSPSPGVKLLVGCNSEAGKVFADLPRNQAGRALVGDPRNDENLITAQLHLLFIQFHNRVVDRVQDTEPRLVGTELFEEAQRIVRWHYQWIVVHDFLPMIVGTEMRDRVLRAVVDQDSGEPRLFNPQGQPFMPVEFSGAAFRFGHSMVRDNYVINDTAHVVAVFRSAGQPEAEDLGGFRRLPARLQVKWEFFFGLEGRPPVNRSMRIDPFLARQLSHLPPDGAALASLNLRRGVALELPAGLAVADKVGAEPLDPEQLLAPLNGIDSRLGDALLDATPLWYYILCEAMFRHRGLQLGPVGGRIVAEVLLGLLQADPESYLRKDPGWRPELPRGHDHSFTMADLVRFAQDDG